MDESLMNIASLYLIKLENPDQKTFLPQDNIYQDLDI